MKNKFKNMVENLLSGRKLCPALTIFNDCTLYIQSKMSFIYK